MPSLRVFGFRLSLLAALFLCLTGTAILAETEEMTSVSSPSTADIVVDVTARGWAEPWQRVPESVTVTTRQGLESIGSREVSDVEHQAPNLTLPDFSVRWLNFPFIRGIGSGRNAPAVTTLIDGVPQLSYVTANLELLSPERVEIIRGPQGSLYGRNSLAGVVNVVPGHPGDVLEGRAKLTLGNYNLRDIRGSISGPVANLGMDLRLGYSRRDGYTDNVTSGEALDPREAIFGYGQLLFPRQGPWMLRVSMTAEHDRDGDYALGDLGALRATPRQVAHDFVGYARRDLIQPVFTATRQGTATEFSSVTALQNWDTHDQTDGDFSPLDLYRQGTDERQRAWLQEFRLSSVAPPEAENMPRWLAGLWLFSSTNDVTQFTAFSALAAAAQQAPFAFTNYNTAARRDAGVSVYGQRRHPLSSRWGVTLGVRYDYEQREAELRGYTLPALSEPRSSTHEEHYSRVTPQGSLEYRLSPDANLYASLLYGYKVGGFNATAPEGSARYDEETSRTWEVGIKTGWAKNRGTANLCLFQTHWNDLQLDTPIPFMPSQYYIANAGAARSQGMELEVTEQPAAGVKLFAGIGVLSTNFDNGSMASGVNVSDHDLPMAPRLTGSLGMQLSRAIATDTRGFLRLEGRYTGKYFYDASNAGAQDGYTLVNISVGAEQGPWRADLWAKNLFNQSYFPLAYPVPTMVAPSGYVAESGPPRTFGISVTRKW